MNRRDLDALEVDPSVCGSMHEFQLPLGPGFGPSGVDQSAPSDREQPRDRDDVSVAPLRIARGIQNKVLEALAMGLPVVGTTSATQGVEGEPERDYIVRDDADAFADEVVRLLQDRSAADTLASSDVPSHGCALREVLPAGNAATTASPEIPSANAAPKAPPVVVSKATI